MKFKEGDLVMTVIRQKVGILLKKESKQVWKILYENGSISSEWALNLVPYQIEI